VKPKKTNPRDQQKRKRIKQRFSLQKFLINRRGISPVISAMVLIAVVIVLGFSAYSYAQNMASNYQSQYQENINNDIDKLKEALSFEYVHYDATAQKISIYFMNTGTNSFEVNKAYLSVSSTAIEPTVKYFSGEVTTKVLAMGDERLIDISTSVLESGVYVVKIITVRGSSFEYTITV
jgi:flagellin-like protein